MATTVRIRLRSLIIGLGPATRCSRGQESSELWACLLRHEELLGGRRSYRFREARLHTGARTRQGLRTLSWFLALEDLVRGFQLRLESLHGAFQRNRMLALLLDASSLNGRQTSLFKRLLFLFIRRYR